MAGMALKKGTSAELTQIISNHMVSVIKKNSQWSAPLVAIGANRPGNAIRPDVSRVSVLFFIQNQHSSFVIRHSSFVIRHSSFVIRHSE